MEEVDKEISEMKLSLNARARVVAESYLLAVRLYRFLYVPQCIDHALSSTHEIHNKVRGSLGNIQVKKAGHAALIMYCTLESNQSGPILLLHQLLVDATSTTCSWTVHAKDTSKALQGIVRQLLTLPRSTTSPSSPASDSKRQAALSPSASIRRDISGAPSSCRSQVACRLRRQKAPSRPR